MIQLRIKNKGSKMRSSCSILKLCFLLFCIPANVACSKAQEKSSADKVEAEITKVSNKIVLGSEQLNLYLPLLENKKVAFVGNHTSTIGQVHLVDTLLNLGVNITKVFSPEHGFRGTADAGEKVNNEIDERTKLPIFSLYGKNKKPSNEQLSEVEIIVFDIQDVGVRFYTYISTLHYVMEAAAENKIPVVLLDRPNPNGHFVDGPILETKYKSFVGMHPVPVVHGLTIGEYGKMINGEKWLKNEVKCDLTVINCKNYSRAMSYNLTSAPSPNLPNMQSIYLYPSLCFFEGTPISVGRGTSKPFQQIGHPALKKYDYSFTPQPSFGAKYPKLSAQKCFGLDFSTGSVEEYKNWGKLNLSMLLQFYKEYPEKSKFFTNFFNLLAGNSSLQNAIKEGKSETEIREEWKDGLTQFQQMRQAYLIYN